MLALILHLNIAIFAVHI